ncbi:hypothetical protein G9A89_000679 [Geosiphon pyriformis]|nr:hypothetical protein G9A89_000679 [Geosiphon pyriformis]
MIKKKFWHNIWKPVKLWGYSPILSREIDEINRFADNIIEDTQIEMSDIESGDLKREKIIDNGELKGNQNEFLGLRRVSDSIPAAAWLIVLCEFCERFTFYGVSGPFQNYIQFPPPKERGSQPGALGQGQKTATALAFFFNFLCYFTPIFGAFVADKYLGKYRTIIVFSFLYMFGLSILITTSIPAAIEAHVSLPGLLIAMVVIGFGTGGIKSNVSAMVADQYSQKEPYIKTLKTGEKVVVDPRFTIQSIFHWFYLAINIGSLSPIVTTNIEKHHSFWLAFSIPMGMFVIALSLFYLGRRSYIQTPPEGTVLVDAVKIFKIAITNGRNLDRAKPSKMCSSQLDKYDVTWNDKIVDELRSTIQACKVFIFVPLFSLCYNQLHTNLVSQGATMQTGFIPNDVMSQFDPVTVLILIPILDKGFYPILRRKGIILRPVTRIFIGFMFAAVSMGYTTFVQWKIYNTGPCYQNTRCIVDGVQVPNNISIWYQIPTYVLSGISEAFVYITCTEYAYQKAPTSMKSVITGLFLAMSGTGSILGFFLVPLSKDPYCIYIYFILSVAVFSAGIAIICLFGDYDNEEYAVEEKGETIKDS